MILEKLELQDFGPFKSTSIELSPPSTDRHVVVFGGLNGSGKTSILEAIQLCLYGKRARTQKRKKLGYEDYLRRCIRTGAAEHEGASLRLTFSIRASGEDESITIARDWHVNGSGIKEQRQVLRNGSHDEILTEQWDEYVDRLIPLGVSDLFFFDGERIEQFADLEASKGLLATAVQSLLGLDLVEKLIVDLKVLEKRKTSEFASPETQNELSQAEKAVRKAKDVTEKSAEGVSQIEERLNEARKTLAASEERYRIGGGELYEERGKLEESLETLKEEERFLLDQLQQIASGKAPLLLVLPLLKQVAKEDSKDQQRESSAVLSSVLKEREKGLEAFGKKTGIKKAEIQDILDYLKADSKARTKKSKEEIIFGLSQEMRSSLANLLQRGVKDEQKHARKQLDLLNKKRIDIVNTERKAQSIPHKDTVSGLAKERDHDRRVVIELELELESAQLKHERTQRDLESQEKNYEKIHGTAVQAEISNYQAERVVHFSESSRKLLDTFQTKVRSANVSRIELHVLESFKRLMRKESLVQRVEIDPETLMLTVWGEGEAELHPDRMSAAERQILAISLLWGMAGASQRMLPVVIDTPFSRLDGDHRSKFIDRYFPTASHQVILLSTDEEIDEKHFAALEKHIGHSYLLEHDEELQQTEVIDGYFFDRAN